MMANAFPSSVNLTLSVAFPVALGLPPLLLPLTQQTNYVPLSDAGGDVKSYSPNLWLSATPALGQWPTAWPNSTAAIFVSVVNTSMSVTLPAWTCSDGTTQTCTGGGNQQKCSTNGWYRQYSYATSFTLHPTLPAACASGPCAPSGLSTDSCSQAMTLGPQVSLSQADYNADGGTCANGSPSPPAVAPTFVLRSADDPRTVAALASGGCSTVFAPPAKLFAASGIALTIAGCLLFALGLFWFIKATKAERIRREQQLAAELTKMQTPIGGQLVGVPGAPPQQPGGYVMPPQPVPYGGGGGGGGGASYGAPGYAAAQQMTIPQSYGPGGYAPSGGYAPQPGLYAPPQAMQYAPPQPVQYGQAAYGQPQANALYAPRSAYR